MKHKQQHGFILLFAVLLVSIVLTITLVLLDITLRQLVLSAINRDSQKAYYAAYAGIDCAIFWDRDNPNGDSAKPFGSFENGQSQQPANTTDILCSDFNGSPLWSSPTATIRVPFSDGSCALVTVTKASPSGQDGDTVIVSNGYNMGDSSHCPSNINQIRLVERTLRTTYNDNWK